MTSTKENTQPKDLTFKYNRFLYGTFIVLSIYFLITGQLISAMTNLGTALIFDPFDQKVAWQNRPLYQRVWLIVHLALVLGLAVVWLVERFS